MNRCTLIGRAGADAELRYTPNGHPVINFSIATSEKKGEQYETQWHKIVLYGKSAESYAQRIKKGIEVFVDGKILTRAWTDSSGQKKSSFEIIANWVRVIEKNNQQNEEIPF